MATEAEENLPEGVAFHDASLSWQVFCWMEALGWKFLPQEGGLLDQPEGLMDDLAQWVRLRGIVEWQIKHQATGSG